MKTKLISIWVAGVLLFVPFPGFVRCEVNQTENVGRAPSPVPPAQIESQINDPPTSKSPAEQLLDYERVFSERAKEYQEFLGHETDRHQGFIQHIFTVLSWALGVIAVLFAASLTILYFKSRKDIREEIETHFKAKVNALMETRMAEFEKHVVRQKELVAEQTAGFEKDIRAKFDQLKFDTDRGFETLAEYASVIGHAAVVIGSDEKNDPPELRKKTREELRDRLLALQERSPAHRTLAIFIGRLLRQMGETRKAIEVLDRALNARKAQGLAANKDDGALLFNKACYLNLVAREDSTGAGEDLSSQARAAIRESIKLDPSNLEEAKLDPDLHGLEQS